MYFEIPDNVLMVLADPKASSVVVATAEVDLEDLIGRDAWTKPFWVLAAALRLFIERTGELRLMPISSQLPDMTSDSKRYAQLLGVYRSNFSSIFRSKFNFSVTYAR